MKIGCIGTFLGMGCAGVFLVGFFIVFSGYLYEDMIANTPVTTKVARDIPKKVKPDSAQQESKKERFKKWALENTAVTDIAIDHNSLFVTLSMEKYTNPENVRVIAQAIAKAYVMQTGATNGYCRIYLDNKEYAKGVFHR